MNKFTRYALIVLSTILYQQSTAQGIILGSIFTDNMVLQQDSKAPIYGSSKAGAQITAFCSWNSKTYRTQSGSDGKWTINVQTPKAGGPFSISIRSDKTKIDLKNVYIGEVWLASGQSNMNMPLRGWFSEQVHGSNEAIMNSTGKQIHFITVPINASLKAQESFSGSWQVASSANVGELSAVSWFYADYLFKHLNVPIGIISSSVSGTILEAWMTPEACSKFDQIVVPPTKDTTNLGLNMNPASLYNSMINPIVGYTIKGMIWYQGESNIGLPQRYPLALAAMIESYRERWNCGDFAFYYVQIAPYDYKYWGLSTKDRVETSAYFRSAQEECLTLIPNSGIAVTIDVGEPKSIHPPHKDVVAQRLAIQALAKTYGMKGMECESPRYSSMSIDGDKIHVYFAPFANEHVGLTAYGRDLQLFEIASDNGVFFKAEARIDFQGVVVWSDEVKNPKAVRYAFRDYVKGELFSLGGFPVPSFRTDNW